MDVVIFQTRDGVKKVNSCRKFKCGQISGSILPLAREAIGAFNKSRPEGVGRVVLEEPWSMPPHFSSS